MKASDFRKTDRVRWIQNGTYRTGTVFKSGRKWVYVVPDGTLGERQMHPLSLQHINSEGNPR